MQFGHSADDVQVSMSHDFTELGLLERENAAVLNASLRPLADRIIPAFQSALEGGVCCVDSAHSSTHATEVKGLCGYLW